MSDLIKAEYGAPSAPARRAVVIDPVGEVVTFFRCFLPKRFLSFGPVAEHTCPLEDVRGCCRSRVRGPGRVLEIVTDTGRARLPCAATGFAAVRAAIEEAVDQTGGALSWYEYPAGQFLLVMAVVVTGAAVGLGVWVAGVVPEWALAVPLGAAMAIPVLVSVAAWWRGHVLW